MILYGKLQGSFTLIFNIIQNLNYHYAEKPLRQFCQKKKKQNEKKIKLIQEQSVIDSDIPTSVIFVLP